TVQLHRKQILLCSGTVTVLDLLALQFRSMMYSSGQGGPMEPERNKMFQITQENLRISKHARAQMAERQVTPREVYDIAIRPFITEAQPDGRERRLRDNGVV